MMILLLYLWIALWVLTSIMVWVFNVVSKRKNAEHPVGVLISSFFIWPLSLYKLFKYYGKRNDRT